LALCLLLGFAALVAAGGEYVDNEAGTEIDASNEDITTNMNAEDLDNAPFVPTMNESDDMEVEEASEVSVENDEASDEEESMISDEESDEADELEGNGEFSFIESSADAETDADKPKKKPAKIVPKDAPKAPAPIKEAPKSFKFHPERIEAASTNKFEDPEMAKLNLALEAVKEDILSTNKQITDERKWVIAVAKIIASYNDKMKRVEAHIIALRKEMKALYRKKKQIENLKLQKALESKLKEARDELATLTHSLKHVAVKQGELNRSGSDLRQTIAGIQAQLAKLRGQQLRSPRPAPRKRCKKGMRFSKKAKKCVARKARKSRKAGKKF